jgi:hypothetical protein
MGLQKRELPPPANQRDLLDDAPRAGADEEVEAVSRPLLLCLQGLGVELSNDALQALDNFPVSRG